MQSVQFSYFNDKAHQYIEYTYTYLFLQHFGHSNTIATLEFVILKLTNDLSALFVTTHVYNY